jgi:hypothetical protein
LPGERPPSDQVNDDDADWSLSVLTVLARAGHLVFLEPSRGARALALPLRLHTCVRVKLWRLRLAENDIWRSFFAWYFVFLFEANEQHVKTEIRDWHFCQF